MRFSSQYLLRLADEWHKTSMLRAAVITIQNALTGETNTKSGGESYESPTQLYQLAE
jgi:hypothetical protein